MSKVLAHARGRQVLTLLIENGPMSIRGIEYCLAPAICRKRLYEVLKRLEKLKVIESRVYPSLGRSIFFYALRHESECLKTVSRMVGATISVKMSPRFRRIELVHSELCAIWKMKLKRDFPNAEVFRDHEYGGFPGLVNVLQSFGEEREMLPDLIVHFGANVATHSVSIAFEIERTPKSNARLLHKLKKYATQSRLDGVVYVCDGPAVSERIRKLYRLKIIPKSLRILPYGKHFLLFSSDSFAMRNGSAEMSNADSENVSLSDWVHTLRRISARSRKDADFKCPGQPPWTFSKQKNAELLSNHQTF